MRFPSFVLSCLWGACCGAVLGAVRTREAALHLLAKGKALEGAGIPSLPGPSHWDVLASWSPPGAGALFFGLSLGLGLGALASLWIAACRGLPERWARSAPWLVAAAPVWAILAGDWPLGATLLAIVLGLFAAAGREQARPGSLPLACACVAALGLIPWARAPEGAFSRLRDNVLLATRTGLTANDFYYRWTLYPAEALKALDAVSQPVGIPAAGTELPKSFCAEALRLRILCLPKADSGADFRIEADGNGLSLVSGSRRVRWPSEPSARPGAWAEFGLETDSKAPFRKATALALFTGCPVGLAWALGSFCAWLGPLVHPQRRQLASLALASVVAVAVALPGRADPALQALRGAAAAQGTEAGRNVTASLSSPRPAARLAAARAATALGPEAQTLLLGALHDPVLNVRYGAAEALGAVGGEGAKGALLETLRGSEEWYVKERAYAALWRLGWRPSAL